MKQPNNDRIVSSSNQRITGINAHLTGAKTEIPVKGGMVKPAAMVAVFQHALDTRAAVVTARGVYKAALVQRAAADDERVLTDDALKSWVLNRFGDDSVEAHAFGYVARKAATPSAQKKANAAEKRKATREARGTRGSRQKLEIKGSLNGPTDLAAPAQTSGATAAPATAAPVAQGGGATNGAAHS